MNRNRLVLPMLMALIFLSSCYSLTNPGTGLGEEYLNEEESTKDIYSVKDFLLDKIHNGADFMEELGENASDGIEEIKSEAQPIKEDISGWIDDVKDLIPEDETQTIEETETTDLGLTIYYLDVGQGAATLLVGDDGSSLLIDCGDNGYEEVMEGYLDTYLPSKDTLDYLVTTHFDSDHYGTLEELVLKNSKVNKDTCFYGIWNDTNESTTYKYTKSAFEKSGIEMTAPRVTDSFALGEATVTFIAPIRTFEEYEFSENNYSIALVVEYGNTTFLFTGDAEREAEIDMVNSGLLPKDCDVLMVGHHGSSSSSTEEFLAYINPKNCLISCGPNDYGIPTDATLRRLGLYGRIYRTDLCGTVICHSDKTEVWFG